MLQAARENPDANLHLIVQSAEGADRAQRIMRLIEAREEATAQASQRSQLSSRQSQERKELEARQAGEKAALRAQHDRENAALRNRKAAEKRAAQSRQRDEARALDSRHADERRQLDERQKAEAGELSSKQGSERDKTARGNSDDKQFRFIAATSMELKGRYVLALARSAEKVGLIVTLDAPVEKSGSLSSNQLWTFANGAAALWSSNRPAPAIAIVDSGIEKNSPSFGDGSRIVARQVFASLGTNSGLDGRGHGTFVAGIAAGEAPGYAGVSPRSNLIDLDVMNDIGQARTSDVLKAAEWIYQNRQSKNIRVANFSLHSTAVLSIKNHPLNRAVEKLWFGGVVVVAAAGNYGIEGGPSGVHHAPGNDPFVITVGAMDLDNSVRVTRHDIPSWSAYGYTNEGFSKPDVIAAGRYLVGPVPTNATLKNDKPANVVSAGYMRLSGTSFAAPIVSGIAAQVLARYPNYTPDQVKGVLMSTARRIPDYTRLQQGRGEVNALRAVMEGRTPPNPNAALNRFVAPDPTGEGVSVFNATAWYLALKGDTAWDASAWLDSAWADSGWADSGWADSGWADSAWLDSAWLDSAWADSAWADSTSYEDNADGEGVGADQLMTPELAEELASEPGLVVPGDEPELPLP